MHSVIIGNGILALTAAFRLAKRAGADDDITIIGRSTRPGSATLAAGAMLNSFAEIDADTLSSKSDCYRFELSHLATRMWPRFIREIIEAAASRLPPACAQCAGPCGGCFDTGTYIVDNTTAEDLDDRTFDAIVDALVTLDEPHRYVSPLDIPNYAPEQRHRATRAVYLPNEGWVNPRLIVEALQAALASFPQVHLVDGSVERIVEEGRAIASVALEGGQRISGDKFLLATGATASDLLQRSNLSVFMQRVFYGVGVSLEIRSVGHPYEKTIRTPNHSVASGIYAVPYFVSHDHPRNHILVGATHHVFAVPAGFPSLASVESLTRGAIEQVNAGFRAAQLVRVNVGWRPTSQDTYPLVGPTSISNFFIATGTRREGFHLSPLLSQYLASMLLGEPVDERFATFAPERKPIRESTRADAIDKAVRRHVSAARRHGFSPSKSGVPAQTAEAYREDLERLHDMVGAHDWGIPPEMIEMYRTREALADGSYPTTRKAPIGRRS